MELKPGYKQTEVGFIPMTWRVSPISSLLEKGARITYGVVQPGKDDPGGVLFIRGGDVFQGKISAANLRRIPNAVSRQYERTILRGGELVISLVGFPGECAIVPMALAGANIARQVALVRFADDGEAHPAFVCHYLQSNPGRTLLLKEAFGSAQKVINLKDVNRLELPLPPLPDQHAIAEALGDMDGLVDGLDRQVAKKRNLKQAAMQQLLTGQARLSGFTGEWEVKRLGEVAEIGSGGTPSTTDSRFWNGDILWCTPTDITALAGRKYLWSTARTITSAGLAASAAEIVPPRSVVMTSRATIGECAINAVPLSTNQGFKNFVPFAGTDVEFFYYLLSTQKQGFIRLCGGSTFLEIGKTQLTAYEVRLPASKEEQSAIAAVLSDMDAELTVLEVRRDKTRDLKQAMMQGLLTGRTRLVESEAAHA